MIILSKNISEKYHEQIRQLRIAYELTQEALAEKLGVSFATVNRWENGQTKPSKLSWNHLCEFEKNLQGTKEEYKPQIPAAIPGIDFTADPAIIKTLAQGERLSFGHLSNPAFGTEISYIDPLPHQRIAVYDHMIKQERLRFLLADDAGAGKTIMTGLYMREQFSRRLLKRVLIVAPAGLVGNWRRELAVLFKLSFRIITGADFKGENPFIGDAGNQLIISIDTLASSRVFRKLQEEAVDPYDLVVFDEAHKLSVNRGNDLRIRSTDRYNVGEAIAGVKGIKPEWQLTWAAHHLLLLTATPHMGKEYPYYGIWRLLEPEILSTPEAFNEFPPEQRCQHFIRRTKEEMVFPDGRKLYPVRITDTLSYDLTQGDISEQRLYDETTEYLRYVYNKAKMLNREAARLAMSVFQRRLASSTFALLCSFERRLEKLSMLIKDVEAGKITNEQLCRLHQQLSKDVDVFESKSADEEECHDGMEENELVESELLKGVVAVSLAELQAEKEQVEQLVRLAKAVNETGTDAKFEKVYEIVTSPEYIHEKLIIFTEHRDTLTFIVRRLSGMGFTGQIAQIHGGMDYKLRESAVDHFKKPLSEGGARFLVCTDAAGEGINLQFCWIMINYDIPWNPARLEQRMGRIHRYGQKHDPVIILNLVAPKTREGKVLKVLLDKMEIIRKELKSDKVFDVVGRLFENFSIKQYMEVAITEGAEGVAALIEGSLTKEQVVAIEEKERLLYGSGGDVQQELPRLTDHLERETYLRLLPGHVMHYIEHAAEFAGLEMVHLDNDCFNFVNIIDGALDSLISAMAIYPESSRQRFTVFRPSEINRDECIWLHPGEPVFEAFRERVNHELCLKAQRGALFIDPLSDKPYFYHLAKVTIVRQSDPEMNIFKHEEILECKIIGIRQFEGSEIEVCPIEHLLMLKNGSGIPPKAQRFALTAQDAREHVKAFILERVARELALERKQSLLQSLPERKSFIEKGFDFREAELATARAIHAQKARAGNNKATQALTDIKDQQKKLSANKEEKLAGMEREPELIAPGSVEFIAHALVVPSTDAEDLKELDANSEQTAIKLAWAYEEAAGATVTDVSTPKLAREAGLSPHPGFDLLSVHPNGEKRAIEVKGRLFKGDIQVYDNEWAKACNLREVYWLYVAFDCASSHPRLLRVQDPFGKLLARQFSTVREEHRVIHGQVHRGGVALAANHILEVSEKDDIA